MTAADRRQRRGTLLVVAGLVTALAAIVGFASCGYVGAREEVFGGWIVLCFAAAVGSLAMAGYGMTQRRRAERERQGDDAQP